MVCESWITEADITACEDADFAAALEAFDDDTLADLLIVASELMYVWSGRRWSGHCTATVIPCGCFGDGNYYDSPTYGDLYYGSPTVPYRLLSGGWTNVACGCRRKSARGCAGFEQVTLGTHRLVSVDSVTIGGDVVSSDAYRVDEGRYLVRTDGGSWPCCSRNWQVTFTYGRRPPVAGVRSAAKYAAELVKACDEASFGQCALPDSVTQVVRDDATFQIIDPQQYLENGRTGLRAVDDWLQAINPRGSRRRGRVWSPTMGGKVRRISSSGS